MTRYKRLWCIINCILIMTIFFGAFSTTTFASDSYDFANFSEADSIAFVENCEIDIPTKLLNSEHLATFTKSVILQSYNSPNEPFCFNYEETQRYAENIRMAVISHMNLGSVPSVASTTTYTLQYNKVMDSEGNWVTSGGYYNSKWSNYNCYAFSINRAEQPRYYDSSKQYQPGDMSLQGNFHTCDNINELAQLVQNDLFEMGYTDISLTSYIPSINSSQELICVRMLDDIDYHFMRYDIATDAWYHKPGNTAVLKYNTTPSNSSLWYSEYSYYGVEHPSTFEYNSDIVFIAYSKNQINVSSGIATSEYIQPNKDVFCEFNVESAGMYDIQLTSLYSFEYEIYDEDFDVKSFGSGTDIDLHILLATGKYYLRMNFETNTILHYVDVQINQHTHAYDSYSWYSFIYHTSSCDCGASQLSSHVVRSSAGSGLQQYTICLLCGGQASVGMVGFNSISELYHTTNGSYILPNGVIVLVDEDIDTYMNGDLVFYIGDIK